MATALATNFTRDWLSDWIGRTQLIANRIAEASADAPLDCLLALVDELPPNAKPFSQIIVRHVVCRALDSVAAKNQSDTNPDATTHVLRLLRSPIATDDWRDPLRETIELCRGALAQSSACREAVDPSLAHIVAVLDVRFRDPALSLSALAKDVNLSPWHVVRLLRAHTGRGFVGHIRERRVAEAGRLLRETRLNGKQIAAEVGYRHARQLGRDFRQICGVTPTAFRQGLLPLRAQSMARLFPRAARKGQK